MTTNAAPTPMSPPLGLPQDMLANQSTMPTNGSEHWSIPDDLFDFDEIPQLPISRNSAFEPARVSAEDLFKPFHTVTMEEDDPMTESLNEFAREFSPMVSDATDTTSETSEEAPRRCNTSDLLHRMFASYECTLDIKVRSLLNAVEHTVRMDPAALARPAEVHQVKALWSPREKKLLPISKSPCAFQYPLHMALDCPDIPREILRLLLQLAAGIKSDVLTIEDGPKHETPIFLLLRRRPNDAGLLDIFLRASRSCVSQIDREANTALHAAAQHGASLRMMRRLYALYPAALQHRNAEDQTPLDIAATLGDLSVINFLTARSKQSL